MMPSENLGIEISESARRDWVSRLKILHTPPEKNFDDLTEVARAVTGCAAGFITYVNGESLWIKSRSGHVPWAELSRNDVPCGKALERNHPVIVPDLEACAVYKDSAREILEAGYRFYATVPLVEGELAVGTLCVLDTSPQELTERQKESLAAVARSAILESERRTGINPDRLISEVLRLRLSNAQLKEAMRSWQDAEVKLRHSFRQRDDFLAVATHELRTPVTTMKLVLQLLSKIAVKKEMISREEVMRSLDPAIRQTDRLRLLIDNLLDLTRIREGRLEIEPEEFDITALVRDVCSRLQEQVSWTRSTLELHTSGPTVGKWDRLRIEQVVTNLVTNAIKYGEGNPIHLSVDGDDNDIIFKIEDRGIGIAPQDQETIFRQYERATLLHHTDSMGLGLYIVKEIIETHRGTITVQSEVGQGAIFTVKLPKCTDHPKYC